MSHRAGAKHRQRGVALIIALILVALATILATKLSFDSWVERRRTLGILGAEQAVHFAMGAEALAADVLTQQSGGGKATRTLADAWAQPSQPLPLTPENDAEGEPIGTLQGSLEDMQGRFNLNSLGSMIDPTHFDPIPLEFFQRLLQLAGLEPKWAGLARDWIDANDTPENPDGAEDSVYTSQTPPYRTGNYPMTSPTELMNLPGFGAERYRKIAPYVTALPSSRTTINLCTAPALVLESLAPNLNGEYSRNPAILTEGRKNGCFPTVTEFTAVATQAVYARIGTHISDKSSYFRLTTRVTLGTTEFTLYSLLQVTAAEKVAVLTRTFGTL